MTLRVENLCKFSVIKEQPLYCEIYIQVYHQVPTVNVRGKKKKKKGKTLQLLVQKGKKEPF